MRGYQETEQRKEEKAVKKAVGIATGQIETYVAARGLGTVGNLPPVIKPLPVYDDDGNEVEFFAYGDAYGSKPLYGGGF